MKQAASVLAMKRQVRRQRSKLAAGCTSGTSAPGMYNVDAKHE
jgi:hypothetical protein